jgi:hypothetical protein
MNQQEIGGGGDSTPIMPFEYGQDLDHQKTLTTGTSVMLSACNIKLSLESHVDKVAYMYRRTGASSLNEQNKHALLFGRSFIIFICFFIQCWYTPFLESVTAWLGNNCFILGCFLIVVKNRLFYVCHVRPSACIRAACTGRIYIKLDIGTSSTFSRENSKFA